MKYPEIAKRFQYILDLRQMKARELAEKAGMTEAAISHYVHGNRCPNNKTAYELGKILNCSAAWLMDLDSEMEPHPVIWKVDKNSLETKQTFNDFYDLPKKTQERLIPYIKALIEAEKNRGDSDE